MLHRIQATELHGSNNIFKLALKYWSGGVHLAMEVEQRSGRAILVGYALCMRYVCVISALCMRNV